MTLKGAVRLGLAIATVVVAQTHLRGEIRILGVEVASGYAPGLPYPGSLATVFCTGLTNITGVIQSEGPQLPRSLAGVKVMVGNIAAPLLAVADFKDYQQINFQVPWEGGNSTVTVVQGTEQAVASGVQNSNRWSVFFADSAGYVAAQHASDNRPVTRENPARRGELIIVYASNLGSIVDPPPTGVPAPLDRKYPLDVSKESYYLLTSGSGNFVSFMGLAPGLVGVYQINFVMSDIGDVTDVELSVERVRHCAVSLPYGDPACLRGSFFTISTVGRLPVAKP